MAFGTMADTH